MNQKKKKLLSEVEGFVTGLFSEKINYRFAFHNINHTKNVVAAAKKIAQQYKLNEADRLALISACWLHDTGFSSGVSENHEAASKAIAKKFLQNKADDKIVEKVLGCIQATCMPQKSVSIIQKIICDADLYHLGTGEFKKFSGLLKKEREIYYHKKISDREWLESDIKFLITHKYFTRFCRVNLEPVTLVWLQKLLASESKV